MEKTQFFDAVDEHVRLLLLEKLTTWDYFLLYVFGKFALYTLLRKKIYFIYNPHEVDEVFVVIYGEKYNVTPE